MPLTYPTTTHERAAGAITEFFAHRPSVDAIIVVASCSRGMAEPESDLDLAVLVSHERDGRAWKGLEDEWTSFRTTDERCVALCELSLYAQIHLDLIDAEYVPTIWDDGGGPDDFELLIGNQVAYGASIWEGNDRYAALGRQWLPYYDESLRSQRLSMVRDCALLDLDFIPFYRRRALYFQAFDRLYKSFREFLQGLFIARRTYPIVYNKWIRYQVVEMLGLPELYAELPSVLEVPELEGDGIQANADHLRALVEAWLR